ncbi:MAG: LacI family DNA-binding transcriptional regulator [Chloroflexota bacterium]
MATIKDVAKQAGVAISTVSYALSGTRPVAKETRERILRAVEELNYHPNLLASAMIQKRTRIIALLYPALFMSSMEDLPMEYITSITDVTYQHGYELLLVLHPIGEPELMRFINQGLVDGVILMEVHRQDPRVDLMKRCGYPFSLIGHGDDNTDVSFVDMDFFTAYRSAVTHLVELGHHTIGFLPGIVDLDYLPHNYLFESVRGFRDTVAQLGIQGTILACEPTIQSGYAAMQTLLDQQPELTAVIVVNELIFNGASKAIRERNLTVPDDISIIATISRRLAEKYTPKVTTVSVPAIEMGRLGAEFLIQKLEDSAFKPQQVLLSAEFTLSQSTGPRKQRA